MDVEKTRNLLNQLDQLVPKDNAAVLMKQYGGGPDESQIIANERGYLRLGIEMAKLAFEEKGKEGAAPDFVFLESAYLLLPGSTIRFDWCERKEIVRDDVLDERWYEKSLSAGCLMVLLAILGLALYGFQDLLRKLF